MVAKDTDTIKVLRTRLATKLVNGKVVMENGKKVYERVSYFRTEKLASPLKGATGVWQSNFATYSQLNLYAVPKA